MVDAWGIGALDWDFGVTIMYRYKYKGTTMGDCHYSFRPLYFTGAVGCKPQTPQALKRKPTAIEGSQSQP